MPAYLGQLNSAQSSIPPTCKSCRSVFLVHIFYVQQFWIKFSPFGITLKCHRKVTPVVVLLTFMAVYENMKIDRKMHTFFGTYFKSCSSMIGILIFFSTGLICYFVFIALLGHEERSLPSITFLKNILFSNQYVQSDYVVYDNHPNIILYQDPSYMETSKMKMELMDDAKSQNYVPVFGKDQEIVSTVRAALLSSKKKRFFVHTNSTLSRASFPGLKVVTVKTILDGFLQMKLFCRIVRSISKCDIEMESCVGSIAFQREASKRWNSQPFDYNYNNYVDLPLSPMYPAISTAIVRTILRHTPMFSRSTYEDNNLCADNRALRSAYEKSASLLDNEVDMMKERMVVISGYTVKREQTNVTTDDILEHIEKEKLREVMEIDMGI